MGAAPRFRSRRTIGLLGYLAAERRPIAREHLAALFWPDEASSRGRANLRRDLHNLAQILPDCWELDRQSVTFVPPTSTTVDLYNLLELEAQERWGEAAELLGGEFLEGVYLDDNPEFENWLRGERERWRSRAEAVLKRVIEGYWRRGRYTDALHHAQHLLQLAPWNEETHAQIMRLLAWTGQRGAALRQFVICKQTLLEELGVEPALETIDLYNQIQTGKLDLPPQLPAFLTEEKARHEFERRPFIGREGELAQLDAFVEAALAGQGRMVFVTGGPGRGKTALLDAFTQRAMKMHPTLLVANGKCNAYSGVGDPYLPFRDVMAMLTGDVEGKWDAGAITRDHAQRLWAAFSLVIQVILDHGPHLLDVLVPSSTLLSRSIAAGHDHSPWLPRLKELIKRDWTSTVELKQSHLFQQFTDVLHSIAQEQPLLLILDDIQWADAASISLLFHLGRRLADTDSRLLVACAYRPEEVSLGRDNVRHPLVKVLNEFKRTFDEMRVDLNYTEEAVGRKFVDALLETEPNQLGETFRAILFNRTGGHPLFTIELLRALQERGNLLKDGEGRWIEGPTLDWDMLPARVEAVIEERIDRIDPGLQEILTIASVEGEVFTAQVVANVGTIPERSTLHQLSQDLERRHRLVREEEEIETDQRRMSRYRFGHILFRDYLYKRLSQGEKRLLHGDVATVLEKLYGGQLDEMAVQLGQHFHKAGDDNRAFHYFSMAADRAARIHANDEAISHYTEAIDLADRVSLDVVSLAKLHRGRGLVCETIGEFDFARADFETVLNITHAAGEHQMTWRGLLDLGKLWGSRDYERTRDYFESALELAQRLDDPAVLAFSLNWMGNWQANAEYPVKATECHQDALDIFEDLGDRRGLANTLDLLGIANLLASDLGTSVQYYDRAIPLFRELDDRLGLTSSLIGRATTTSMLVFLASVSASPIPDANLDFDEALRIAREIGSAPDIAWAYWSLGLLHTIHGQFEEALKVIQSGLQIASDIGHREYVVGNQFALGLLYLEVFAPDQAQGQLEGALTLAGALQSPTWLHLVSGALAGAYLLLDNLKTAQAHLEAVISPQTPMDTLGKRYCWARRAELALLQDDPALALDIADRLIASAPGMSPGRVITFLWKVKGEALVAMGHTEEAYSLLHAALENARAIEERYLLWRVHASLGRLYCALNQPTEAQKEYSAARELIDELATTVPDKALRRNLLQRAYNTVDLREDGE